MLLIMLNAAMKAVVVPRFVVHGSLNETGLADRANNIQPVMIF